METESEMHIRAVAKREAEDVWGGNQEDRASQASTALPAPDRQKQQQWDQPSKWQRPGYKGRSGKGQDTGSWWKKDHAGDQEQNLGQETVELIKALTKMCIRHEEELGRLRTETNFMCFCDADGEMSVVPAMKKASNKWQESYAAGTEAHTALSLLSDNGAAKLLGMRFRPERMAKSAMGKAVEEAYLQTPYTDWTRRSSTWNAPAAAPAPEGGSS
ncbi:unnamed protein product [Symbiodinium sp. CCMP2456]|nr:unnamed protein product [Symbiodinium sp. CCMP2456]